jgi:hypothetical protein
MNLFGHSEGIPVGPEFIGDGDADGITPVSHDVRARKLACAPLV